MDFRWGNGPSSLLAGAVEFKVKPARFNPFALPFRHYWRVIVFPSKKAMHSYGHWRSPRPENKSGYEGICIPFWRWNPLTEQPGPKLGEVLFYRGRLGTSVITHEAIHVTASTMRVLVNREAVDLGDENGDPEERFAYTHCSLCRQLVDGFHAVGLLG